MTPDPRLTPRDYRRFDRFNKIMKLCRKGKTYIELAENIEFTYETIRNDIKMLIGLGYLIAEEFIVERSHQKSKKFTAIKDRFLLVDLVPSSVALQKSKAKKEAVQIVAKVSPMVEVNPPWIRDIAERHPHREPKKSPRVWVGCTFGMV